MIVISRRAMAGENAMLGLHRGRQFPEPRPMVLVKLRMGISVRCAQACWIRSRHPAIVIATDSQVIPMHEEIAHLARPERSGYAIAQIDDTIDGTMLDVGEHGFERRQVSVDVGYYGYAHRALQTAPAGV